MNIPRIIQFSEFPSKDVNSQIVVAEIDKHIPFSVKRTCWIHSAKIASEHGQHAHLNAQQMIVAIKGIMVVELMDRKGNISEFELDNPSKGLYIPQENWLCVRMSANSALLCFSSHLFQDQDTSFNKTEFLVPS